MAKEKEEGSGALPLKEIVAVYMGSGVHRFFTWRKTKAYKVDFVWLIEDAAGHVDSTSSESDIAISHPT